MSWGAPYDEYAIRLVRVLALMRLPCCLPGHIRTQLPGTGWMGPHVRIKREKHILWFGHGLILSLLPLTRMTTSHRWVHASLGQGL